MNKLLICLGMATCIVCGCVNLNGTNDYAPSQGTVNADDFSPLPPSNTNTRPVLPQSSVSNGVPDLTVDHGIPNFDVVDWGAACAWVYRGGQPTTNGWAYLKALGVKYVVKLNDEAEGSDAEAERLGMKVSRFPLPPADWDDVFEEPKLEDVKNAVMSVESGSFTSVYVHCTHGQDRTGLVVGAYRISFQSKRWDKGAAYAEMVSHGFHPELLGLVRCWVGYPYLPWSETAFEPWRPK